MAITDRIQRLRASGSSPEAQAVNDAIDRVIAILEEDDDAYLVALRSARGYLLNAKFDLQGGTKRSTALATVDGGLRVVDEALARAESHD